VQGQPLRETTRRGLEWSLLLLIILLVVGFYARAFRAVQAQGEAAAVKTTLGALRTALLFDHLKAAVDGTAATRAAQANPFLLLDPKPANYAGERTPSGPLQLAGTWVFDVTCRCIGYQPLYPLDLNTPEDAPALWFRISTPSGPLQLRAVQRYVWQGQVLE
jgi:hypothetical protein